MTKLSTGRARLSNTVSLPSPRAADTVSVSVSRVTVPASLHLV